MGGSREPVSETVMFSSLNWPPIRPIIFLKRLVYACPFLESMPTACTPPRRQLPRGERPASEWEGGARRRVRKRVPGEEVLKVDGPRLGRVHRLPAAAGGASTPA